MPTTFETPFADLTNQWIEASTRAFSASAELYTQALTARADATRELVETYAGLSSQTTERTAEATTEVARESGRAPQRAPGPQPGSAGSPPRPPSARRPARRPPRGGPPSGRSRPRRP